MGALKQEDISTAEIERRAREAAERAAAARKQERKEGYLRAMREWLGAFSEDAMEIEVIAEALVTQGVRTSEDLAHVTEGEFAGVVAQVGVDELPPVRQRRLWAAMQAPGRQEGGAERSPGEIIVREVQAVGASSVIPKLPGIQRDGTFSAAVLDIYEAQLRGGVRRLRVGKYLDTMIEDLLADPTEETMFQIRGEAAAGERSSAPQSA